MIVDLAKYGLHAQFPEVIDSSMLADYVNCPSMFYLRHVLGLKQISRDPADDAKFDWGTIWHKLMEVWAETGDTVTALEVLNDWPASIRVETDRHGRSKERMAKIFFDYIEKYSEDDMQDFQVLRNEQFFDVFNDELGLRWSGRMDKVVRRTRNGKLVVWDYKTTSAMGKWYFEQYQHSFQLPGYCWAAGQIMTDPLDQVLIDVVYTLKGGHEFYRRSFYYTPETIKEWVANVKLHLEDLYYMRDHFLEDPSAWKKSWTECTRYGICQFAPVHFVAPIRDNRLLILQNDYHEERWDPRLLEDTTDE